MVKIKWVKKARMLIKSGELSFVFQIGSLLALSTLSIHYFGCLFVYIGVGTDGWVEEQENENVDGEFQDVWYRYLNGIYWAGATSMTVGYGDLAPINGYEKGYTVIVIIISAFINAAIMGSVTVLLSNLEGTERDYYQKVVMIHQFFRKHKDCISEKTKMQVVRYLDYMFHEANNRSMEMVFEMLPDRMRVELKMAICTQVVDNCDLFYDAEDSLKKAIVMALTPESCLAGEVVVKSGDIGSCMYFLHEGAMNIEIEGKGVVKTLLSGYYFGEIALFIEGSRRTADIIAAVDCNYFELHKHDLDVILKSFPDFQLQLLETAQRRFFNGNARSASMSDLSCGPRKDPAAESIRKRSMLSKLGGQQSAAALRVDSGAKSDDGDSRATLDVSFPLRKRVTEEDPNVRRPPRKQFSIDGLPVDGLPGKKHERSEEESAAKDGSSTKDEASLLLEQDAKEPSPKVLSKKESGVDSGEEADTFSPMSDTFETRMGLGALHSPGQRQRSLQEELDAEAERVNNTDTGASKDKKLARRKSQLLIERIKKREEEHGGSGDLFHTRRTDMADMDYGVLTFVELESIIHSCTQELMTRADDANVAAQQRTHARTARNTLMSMGSSGRLGGLGASSTRLGAFASSRAGSSRALLRPAASSKALF